MFFFLLLLVGSLFYRNGTLLLYNIGEGMGRYSVASFLNNDHYSLKNSKHPTKLFQNRRDSTNMPFCWPAK